MGKHNVNLFRCENPQQEPLPPRTPYIYGVDTPHSPSSATPPHPPQW